jgi:hypothetical protein
MTNFRFEGYMGEKRKKLVDKFGYDTKNASHLIRLLKMGIEFLTEGNLFVEREDAPQLISIKNGEWTLEQVKRESDKLFGLAQQAYINSKLKDKPDYEKAECLLMDIIRDYLSTRWKEKVEEVECHYCKINFPLQYHPGWGWFHFNTDGGPDIICTNPEVQKRPNPED